MRSLAVATDRGAVLSTGSSKRVQNSSEPVLMCQTTEIPGARPPEAMAADGYA